MDGGGTQGAEATATEGGEEMAKGKGTGMTGHHSDLGSRHLSAWGNVGGARWRPLLQRLPGMTPYMPVCSGFQQRGLLELGPLP